MAVSFLRFIWYSFVISFSIGPVLAPWPLLGAVGGVIKLVTSLSAGFLFTLHSALLLGYAGLVAVRLVSFPQVKAFVIISTIAAISLAVPPLLSVMTCSPEFTVDSQTNNTGFLNSPFDYKGVSFSKWQGKSAVCTPASELKNITTIYKDSFPAIGPATQNETYLNPSTRFFWSFLGNNTPTSLEALYFPVPEEKKLDDKKKPGLLIFVHGGGWRIGFPVIDPFECLADLAFSEGWAIAAMQYRLLRNGWTGDVLIEDVKDAVKYLVKEYSQDIDTSRIILSGSSAGGHLALLAAYQLNNEKASLEEPVISGVLATSPFTSVKVGLREDAITSKNGAWNESDCTRRLCEQVEDCDEKLSPLEHVSKFSPKTILAHAGFDEFYRPRHSRELAQKLSEFKIQHVHMEPPLMSHAFEVGPSVVPTQMANYALRNLMKSLS